MKKQTMIIIIDPWKRPLIQRCLLWLDDQFILFKRIKKFVKSKLDSIHTIVIAAYDDKPVANSILNLPGNKVETIDIDKVLKIIEDNDINKIYFCGSAWDRCVRSRDLGYLNLFNILKDRNIELLVKDDCVVLSEKLKSNLLYRYRIFIPSKNPNWVSTEEPGVYKFNGE